MHLNVPLLLWPCWIPNRKILYYFVGLSQKTHATRSIYIYIYIHLIQFAVQLNRWLQVGWQKREDQKNASNVSTCLWATLDNQHSKQMETHTQHSHTLSEWDTTQQTVRQRDRQLSKDEGLAWLPKVNWFSTSTTSLSSYWFWVSAWLWLWVRVWFWVWVCFWPGSIACCWPVLHIFVLLATYLHYGQLLTHTHSHTLTGHSLLFCCHYNHFFFIFLGRHKSLHVLSELFICQHAAIYIL